MMFVFVSTIKGRRGQRHKMRRPCLRDPSAHNGEEKVLKMCCSIRAEWRKAEQRPATQWSAFEMRGPFMKGLSKSPNMITNFVLRRRPYYFYGPTSRAVEKYFCGNIANHKRHF